MKNSINILIAEDNQDEILLIKEALKDSELNNINFDYVNDGIDAIRYLYHEKPFEHSKSPDILLLDLNMPKMNGYEVLKEIKNSKNLYTLPVIIFSTSTNQDDIEKCYANQANCYINKPTDFYAFKNVLKTIKEHWINIAKLPHPNKFSF